MYNRLLTVIEKDLDLAVENLVKWQSGNENIRIRYGSEDELLKTINAVKAAKAHEQELYEKFLRLRERFIHNPSKLSESIVAYQRCLEIRLKRRQHGYTLEGMSFAEIDEMIALARKIEVVLEENERKLDILLTL